jgi:hypothetical protein
MAEPRVKRGRTVIDDEHVDPKAWRTGTSQRFWDLRIAGHYEEARALILDKCPGLIETLWFDAEAVYELARLCEDRELGIGGGPPLQSVWHKALLRAAALGHPRALVSGLDLFDPTGFLHIDEKVAAIRDYVEACDCPLALWDLTAHYNRGDGTPMTGDEQVRLLELGCQTEHAAEAFFLLAALKTSDFGPCARLGYPRGCLRYTDKVYESIWREPLSMAEKCYYLEVGARQGSEDCINALCKLLFKQESVRDWGRAARILISPFTPGEVWERWRYKRSPDDLSPWVTRYWQRMRELYAYGKWEVAKNAASQLEVTQFYRTIYNTAQRSVVTLIGVLQRRLRPRCPRDVMHMIAKPVWETRDTRTECWRALVPRGYY